MFLRMVRAVLLNEKRNDVHEINVDLSPEKNEIYKILRGKATFLGQWEDELVVILKCRESVLDLKINENVLPRPFSNMEVNGRILLIRMDEESEPQNFTKVEYDDMCRNSPHMTRFVASKVYTRSAPRVYMTRSVTSRVCLAV